jgi:hypothetical protein
MSIDEYYELSPVSPIKKLKKEIEELKKNLEKNQASFQYNEIMKEVMEAIKINQRITEEIIKSNASLQTKISEMIIVMNRLIEEINIMSDSFKKAAEALVVESKTEKTEEMLNKVLENLVKLLNQNQTIIDSLTKLEKQMLQRQLIKPQPTIPQPALPQTPQPNKSLNPLLSKDNTLKLPKL